MNGANWTIRLVFGVVALALVVLGLAMAWVLDHSAVPSLIALAEVLR